MTELLVPALSAYKADASSKYTLCPMFFLSIDPGYDNLGYCYGAICIPKQSATPILYIDKQRFKSREISKMQDASNLDDLAYACNAFYWKVFPDEQLLRKAVVLFERQYYSERSSYKRPGLGTAGHKMVLLEAVLTTIAATKYNCLTVQVHPNSVKGFYGTGKGAHKQNKAASLKYVREVLNVDVPNLNDHMCDALLQAYYYAIEQTRKVDPKALPPKIVFLDNSDALQNL